MSAIPQFPYELLSGERAGAGREPHAADGIEFLQLASRLPLQVRDASPRPRGARNTRSWALRAGRFSGAAVLMP